MAKKNRKHTQFPAAPAAAAEAPRFPAWLAWGAFLLWGGLVFKVWLAKMPPDLNSLFVMLDPGQYLSGALFQALGGHLASVMSAGFFIFACYEFGRLLLAAVFRPGRLSPCEEAAFSAALGLGAIAHLVLGLAAAGLLSKAAVRLLLALALAAGIFSRKRWRVEAEEGPAPDFRPAFPDVLALALLGAALLLNLAGALSPEIFYDSLVYHLAVPNYYAIKGRLADMAYNLYSNLFLLHGMLYSAGLLFRDEMVPKLLNYAAGLFSLLAVAGTARRHLGARAGLWAALVFYAVPQAMIASWSSGTEWLLTLFSVCAFAAALRHEPGTSRFLLLSALFAGCGMAVKTTGLFPAVGTGLVLLYRSRAARGAALKGLLLFGLVASLPVLPWLAKNWLYRGNPFFPFLTSVFGLSGADPARLHGFMVETRQMGALELKQWLLHPWNVTMGLLPNSQYFTPLFLALLPLLFLLRPAAPFPFWLFFLCGWLLWSMASTMARFLMPAYPAGALLIAAGLQGRDHPALRRVLGYAVLAACAVCLYWSGLIFYSQGRWRPVFGLVEKEAYLSDTQPTYPYSHYSAIKFVNEKLPPDAKVLIVGDGRSFYLKKDFIVSSVFDKTPIVEYAAASRDGSDLYARLRAEGVTHLLVNVAEAIKLGQGYNMFYWDDRARAAFDSFWDAHAREVFGRDESQGGRFLNRVAVFELVPRREKGEKPPFNLLRDIVMRNLNPSK